MTEYNDIAGSWKHEARSTKLEESFRWSVISGQPTFTVISTTLEERSAVCCWLSVDGCQLSEDSYQLSVVGYQLSAVTCLAQRGKAPLRHSIVRKGDENIKHLEESNSVQYSVVSDQYPVEGCQLSEDSYQLPVVGYQLSAVTCLAQRGKAPVNNNIVRKGDENTETEIPHNKIVRQPGELECERFSSLPRRSTPDVIGREVENQSLGVFKTLKRLDDSRFLENEYTPPHRCKRGTPPDDKSGQALLEKEGKVRVQKIKPFLLNSSAYESCLPLGGDARRAEGYGTVANNLKRRSAYET